jgi:hypothetical protein
MLIRQQRWIGQTNDMSSTAKHRLDAIIDTQVTRWLEKMPTIKLTKRLGEYQMASGHDPEPFEIYHYTVTIQYVFPQRSV